MKAFLITEIIKNSVHDYSSASLKKQEQRRMQQDVHRVNRKIRTGEKKGETSAVFFL
jgi:hypothetical protein